LTLLTLSLTLADEQPDASALSEDSRSLLLERLAVLNEIAKLQRTGYQAGQVQFNDVLAAEAEVLAAKRELAQTPAERVAILERMLENARQLEQVVEQLAQAREVSPIDALKANAFRLKVQSDLVRARAAPK
jgi:outer membrane protein TolC